MIFTAFLWILVIMIYLSNPNNKANKWCAINGIIFSLGTFKEYFYDEIVPFLIRLEGHLSIETYTAVYSIMTAVLYYLALPSALVFVFYFCEFDMRINSFKLLKISAFMPAIILAVIYNPMQIRYYQLNDKVFWYIMTIFNVGYGILYTVLMLSSLIKEKNVQARKQKRLVAILILPALWFWLVTIFIIHSLGIKELFKLWRGNTFIIGLAILFYVAMAFREGMMGIRLRSEKYKWNADMFMINKRMQYSNHLLKNEISKIEWCINNIRKKYANQSLPVTDEVEIISRSLEYIKSFSKKKHF